MGILLSLSSYARRLRSAFADLSPEKILIPPDFRLARYTRRSLRYVARTFGRTELAPKPSPILFSDCLPVETPSMDEIARRRTTERSLVEQRELTAQSASAGVG